MICPKCGYEEEAPWKNSPHQLFMQYLSPEEALEFVPDVLAAAKFNPKYTEDKYFAYRLTKVGFLHRQPRMHCFNKKWTNYSSCYQKYRKPLPQNQTRLSPVSHYSVTENGTQK